MATQPHQLGLAQPDRAGEPRHAPGHPFAAPAVRRAQRRVVGVLAVTQLLSGTGVAIGVATTSLAGSAIANPTIGGLAASCSVVGTSLAALPLAQLARRFGRRPSLALGYGVGGCGCAVVAAAIPLGAWPVLLVGTLLLGWGTAASFATRYAATDIAEPQRRGTHLALVVWPATIGVVLGPNLAAGSQRVGATLGMVALAGPFALAATAFGAAAVLVASGLRPDPLRLALALHASTAATAASGPSRPHGHWRASLRTVRARRPLRLALFGMCVQHAAMMSVMVMVPIRMQDTGSALSAIGLVVSGHLFGMYAFSPLFGYLSDRLGARRLLPAGTATCALGALLCAGSTAQLAVGMVLLGAGWSCGVVAASAMLSQYAPVEQRPLLQGLSDLLMDVSGAGASLTAGLVVALASFPTLSRSVAAAAALCVLATVAPPLRRPRPALARPDLSGRSSPPGPG